MPLHALQTMVEEDPGNPELIRAMINPALRLGQQPAIDEAMSHAGPGLIDRDPGLVAYYLADLRGSPGIYQPVHLLHLASLMERSGEPERAIHLYRLVSESQPTAPESEAALYRRALCYWNVFKDAAAARSCLCEMEQRFPNGEMLPFGRDLRRKIG